MAEYQENEVKECSLNIKGSAFNAKAVKGDVEKGGLEDDEKIYDAESSALR